MRRLAHLLAVFTVFAVVHVDGQTSRTFRVWVFANAHVGTDLEHGLESLATAIRQSESANGFPWELAIGLI